MQRSYFQLAGFHRRFSTSAACLRKPRLLPRPKKRQDADAWISLLDAKQQSPLDVATLLKKAQRGYGLDLLTYLGVEKKRWDDVKWLMNHLVEEIWKGHREEKYSQAAPWNGRRSLKEITQDVHGIILDPPEESIPTDLGQSTKRDPSTSLSHETLGTIWISLGQMIIEDAETKDHITPEILEMIALLHHNDIMPSSIYAYHPSIRQSPTLHLLSSHILTSLSDAAWRAKNEKSIFKVNVPTISHEVWLELVLWSCLHGGWIEEGAILLDKIVNTKTWSTLSWKDATNIKKTLSAEVVEALIDALLDQIQVRKIPASRVFQLIKRFTVSSDAVVMRFFPVADNNLAKKIVLILSSEFGEGQGTALGIGLMHRILKAYIDQGNVAGALTTFEDLQRMSDRNKLRSIEAFAEKEDHDEIEYPGFYPQLPVTILAPLLDLVVEAKCFDFGKWLLQSQDIDGPTITKEMWRDAIMGPALIRFASAVDDADMLVELIDTKNLAISPLIETQVHLKKWSVVDTLLDMADSPIQGRSIATIARSWLQETDPSDGPSRTEAVERLLRILSDSKKKDKIQSTLLVLACIDSKWERTCLSFLDTPRQRYTMTIQSFNIILDGVVDVYGTERAKKFLGRFWKQDRSLGISVGRTRLFGSSFTPNINTINIILRKAPKEEKTWAKKCMLTLGLSEEEAMQEVGRVLRQAD